VQVLRFPSHGGVDACPAAGVIVEEKLLNRAGIELAVISELQANLGFGIRLASRIQPEDVRFVFLDSRVSLVDRDSRTKLVDVNIASNAAKNAGNMILRCICSSCSNGVVAHAN
jgi:hypothetical protein